MAGRKGTADLPVHERIPNAARRPLEIAGRELVGTVIRPLDMAGRPDQEAKLAGAQRVAQPVADAGDLRQGEAVTDQLGPDDGGARTDIVAQLPRAAGERAEREEKGENWDSGPEAAALTIRIFLSALAVSLAVGAFFWWLYWSRGVEGEYYVPDSGPHTITYLAAALGGMWLARLALKPSPKA